MSLNVYISAINLDPVSDKLSELFSSNIFGYRTSSACGIGKADYLVLEGVSEDELKAFEELLFDNDISYTGIVESTQHEFYHLRNVSDWYFLEGEQTPPPDALTRRVQP